MTRAGPIRMREAVDRLVERLGSRGAGSGLTFCGPDDGRKAIALTFDDGPSAANTPRLLDLMAEHGARATFFVVGDRVSGCEAIVSRILAEGHEIGNHTHTHPHTIGLRRPELRAELERAREAIGAARGDIRVVRPPYGKDRRRIAAVGRELGLRTVLWSIDSGDTWGLSGDEIAGRVLADAAPGAIVLMHDGDGPRQGTLDAAAAVVPALVEQGYELVTVSELLAAPTLTSAHDRRPAASST